MKNKRLFSFSLAFVFLVSSFLFAAQNSSSQKADEAKLLERLHSISSHRLFDYVKELASEKYAGRLTGTEEYNASARWVASHFKKWGISPAGDENTYLQAFPNPYTLVFKDCEVYLHLPYKDSIVKKYYRYEDEFIPGATSGSGEVTAEVVYVGYGITAPELGYDEYKGMDVKGKIVLMEREAPVSPGKDPELFKKWRPYSFHQYKLENAVAHGAKGMLYNYGPISNPNNSYSKDFIYSHVGDAVVSDVFSGTGRKHKDVVEKIKRTLNPQSFATGKVFTIRNATEHHPEGIGYNVNGILEGSDPVLKNEVIILGGHLDHLGLCYEIMPGANDNASAVAVIMGVAEALTKSPVKLRRSVMFLCFGAEEQGVVGSQYYLKHPFIPPEKTLALINMDGVGCGDKISALAAKNYPEFWEFIDRANQKYIHRLIRPSYFANIARPRLDAARFMWKEVPTISISAYGARSYYHITKDDIDTITPEILEDLAQLLFLAVIDMANQDTLDFRK
ncbi:MAG: M28 family peptidase [Candidatus Aminicenantes bacterium]|nr:MAG: M28 family peptidase [Candidatus Aminicenantes bacterium]